MIAIDKYFESVKKFDWFYQMSDDHRVYQNGKKAWSLLAHQSHDSPVHQRILDDWKAYKNSTMDDDKANHLPMPKIEDYLNDEEN